MEWSQGLARPGANMRRLLLSLCLLSACSTPAAVAEPEPPAAPSDDPALAPLDWQPAVDAEARALSTAFPDAEVRIVVLDAKGSTLLASHGDIEVPTPTGSSIKPLTVFAALAEGLDPGLEVDASAPLDVGGVTIEDARNNGVLSLPMAIAKSSNIAIARAVQTVSWQDVYARVDAMVGLPDPTGMPLRDAVGQLDGFHTAVPLRDLVGAYASMTDQPHGEAVFDMLRLAVTEDGTGTRAAVAGLDVLGKTGTARNDDVQDAVFVGRASDGETTVWIGVSVHDVPEDAYGGRVSAPAFAHIVRAVLTAP